MDTIHILLTGIDQTRASAAEDLVLAPQTDSVRRALASIEAQGSMVRRLRDLLDTPNP